MDNSKSPFNEKGEEFGRYDTLSSWQTKSNMILML